jgi:hypothetical protein
LLVVPAGLALIAAVALGRSPAHRGVAGGAADAAAEAARAFLAALDPEQRAAAVFDFDDAERTNWQPVPYGEAGVRLADLDERERALLRELVASVLSERGLATVDGVRMLEGLLVEIEAAAGRPSPFHGAERYFLTVFGDPAGAGTWSMRFEGHHLSLTFTFARGAWTAHGPIFVGAQPARVVGGERDGFRLLGAHDDAVRALVAGLTAEQRARAVLADDLPGNVLLVPGNDEGCTDERGLLGADLDAEQRAQLLSAIELWAGLLRPDLAEAELSRVRDGLAATRLVWIGGSAPHEPHYWRISGPHATLEYVAPEFDPDHVHALWRDPTRDFGGDLLRAHLLEHASERTPSPPTPP